MFLTNVGRGRNTQEGGCPRALGGQDPGATPVPSMSACAERAGCCARWWPLGSAKLPPGWGWRGCCLQEAPGASVSGPALLSPRPTLQGPVLRGSASICQGQLSLCHLFKSIYFSPTPQGRERKGKLERITVCMGDRPKEHSGPCPAQLGCQLSMSCLRPQQGRAGEVLTRELRSYLTPANVLEPGSGRIPA